MDINYNLISAVRDGNLKKTKKLINSYGLSYSRSWSEGYNLLRTATEKNYKDISKLLLSKGSKVNSGNKRAETPLHHAVRNGDTEIVQMLIDRKAKINAKNELGYTPLHYSIKNKTTEITILLLNQNANVNDKSNDNKTPLYFAVTNGDIEILQMLIDRGAAINTKHAVGFIPLHYSIKNRTTEITELLLNHEANVNDTTDDGKTPLHIATQVGCLQIIENLLKHGACVTATSKGMYTPLHFAVETRNEEIAKLLLKSYARVDAKTIDGITPLHIAVEKAPINIIEDLLHHGACVNLIYSTTLRKGYTVLHLAIDKGRENVVNLLLNRGANVDAQDQTGTTILRTASEKGLLIIVEHILKHRPNINNKSNRSSLSVAVQGSSEYHNKIVQSLLEYGLSVNPEDANDPKLVHDAVKKGYLKIVEDLVKYGADVKAINGQCTPLHTATKNKQEAIASIFIYHGAVVNSTDETGKTPIFYAIKNSDLKITKLLLSNGAAIKDPDLLNTAVEKGSKEIFYILLQYGADINACDKFGKTPLHCTAISTSDQVFTLVFEENHEIYVKGEIAEMLLSTSANINNKTKSRSTALHVAAQKGYANVVTALLQYNADINCKTRNNMTALHIAAQKGYLNIVEMLLEFGADEQKIGLTALHYAANAGHPRVVKKLLEHHSDINIVDILVMKKLSLFGANGIATFNDIGISILYSTCRCEEVVEILRRHIVKIAIFHAGRLKSLANYIGNELNDFRDACEAEIKTMKKKITNSNISFHDILTKSTDRLAKYAKNENVLQVSEDVRKKFPIYSDFLNSHLRRGVVRRVLLEQGNERFHAIFEDTYPKLPYNCIEKILYHLCDGDLRIFIGVSIRISKNYMVMCYNRPI